MTDRSPAPAVFRYKPRIPYDAAMNEAASAGLFDELTALLHITRIMKGQP